MGPRSEIWFSTIYLTLGEWHIFRLSLLVTQVLLGRTKFGRHCIFWFKSNSIVKGWSQMGGFFRVVEFYLRWSTTNVATPSSLYLRSATQEWMFYIKTCNKHLKHVIIVCIWRTDADKTCECRRASLKVKLS